jgi:hypothetical protein
MPDDNLIPATTEISFAEFGLDVDSVKDPTDSPSGDTENLTGDSAQTDKQAKETDAEGTAAKVSEASVDPNAKPDATQKGEKTEGDKPEDKEAKDLAKQEVPEELKEPGPDANTPKVREWGKRQAARAEEATQELETARPVLQLADEIGGERALKAISPFVQQLQRANSTGTEIFSELQKIIHPEKLNDLGWEFVKSEESQTALCQEFFGDGATPEEVEKAWTLYSQGKLTDEGAGKKGAIGKDATDDTEDADDLFIPEKTRNKIKDLEKFKDETLRRQSDEDEQKQSTEVQQALSTFDNDCASAVDSVVKELKLEVSDSDDPVEKTRKEFAAILTRIGAHTLYMRDKSLKDRYDNAKDWIKKKAVDKAEDDKPKIVNSFQHHATRIGKWFSNLIEDSRELQRLQATSRADTRKDLSGKDASSASERDLKKAASAHAAGSAEWEAELAGDISDMFRQRQR